MSTTKTAFRTELSCSVFVEPERVQLYFFKEVDIPFALTKGMFVDLNWLVGRCDYDTDNNIFEVMLDWIDGADHMLEDELSVEQVRQDWYERGWSEKSISPRCSDE